MENSIIKKESDKLGILNTDRLVLRRWEESDAEDLFRYASDPDVGPVAGWPAHQSVDESRDVIRSVFNGKEAYAVCLKEDNRAIGAIELKLNGHTDMTDRDDECEMGYWLGKPFWGQGIIPEAVREMLRHAFEDCGMQKVWIGYYEGNTKSRRVQEKCGFKYQWKSEDIDVPLMNEKRTGHVSLMTKEDWQRYQDGKLRKRIRVVAAVIHKKQDGVEHIFATARGYGKYKDWWEFPGGKIEEGETPEEALKREIREELATDIAIGELIHTIEYDYPEFHLSMDCFWCEVQNGNLQLLEAEDAKWLTSETLQTVKWLPADLELIDILGKRLKETCKINTVVFDMDGTILDTLEDLTLSVNHVMEQFGFPVHPKERYRQAFGNSIRYALEVTVPEGTPPEVIDRMIPVFREYYDVHCLDHTRPYEGIIPLMKQLKERGYKMAIVSNKIDSAVKELKERFFSDVITVSIGEKQGIRRKPAPDTVFEALRELGSKAEEAVYIGDSEVDLATAKNAGIPCMIVLWGFRDEEYLRKTGAEVFAGTPDEILQLLSFYG